MKQFYFLKNAALQKYLKDVLLEEMPLLRGNIPGWQQSIYMEVIVENFGAAEH